MHYPSLYKTRTAQVMVPSTAVRVRRLAAALQAILILDWERVRQAMSDREKAGSEFAPSVSRWDNSFAVPHAAWLDEHFGDVLDHFVQWAVALPSFANRRTGERRARLAALAGNTLHEFLARFAWPFVQIHFGVSSIASDAVQVADIGVLRVRLYDADSGLWVWRLAAYALGFGRCPRIADQPMADGERMTAEPRQCAEFRVGSSGLCFKWRDPDPLDVEPVITILPFQDLIRTRSSGTEAKTPAAQFSSAPDWIGLGAELAGWLVALVGTTTHLKGQSLRIIARCQSLRCRCLPDP